MMGREANPLDTDSQVEKKIIQTSFVIVKTIAAKGFTPIVCGKFVDRILSTQPITNGKEWEQM